MSSSLTDNTLTVGSSSSYYVNSSGYLGIGTNSPTYPLTIKNYINGSIYQEGEGQLNYACAAYNTGNIWQLIVDNPTVWGNNNPISIYATGGIITNSFYVVSDERIKTNIESLSSTDSLDKIRLLNPCLYQYKDFREKGTRPYQGFIAQQVEKVIKEAVNKLTDNIPNIYDLAEVKEGNKIVLQNKTTDLFTENKSGEKIKVILYDKENEKIEVYLEKIIDDKTFEINMNLTDNIVFVFGQEVEDFLTVDKDSIFTVVTSALIELDSIVQKQEKIIQDLIERIDKLESKL
jgi:hypothetical protein